MHSARKKPQTRGTKPQTLGEKPQTLEAKPLARAIMTRAFAGETRHFPTPIYVPSQGNPPLEQGGKGFLAAESVRS